MASAINLQEFMIMNMRFMAMKIAEIDIKKIEQNPVAVEPHLAPLTSQIMNQKDFESDWLRYWLHELKIPLPYFRKWWEYAFVLQSLFENGMLSEGKSGLGLGCGEEILPSFLISKGCKISAGDQPETGESVKAWSDTAQHTKSVESLYKPQFLTREKFEKNFSLNYVDMNNLSEELYGKFDFCWSVCVVEHLGSIANGLSFLENSLKLLKPGGVSIHTTEFNYLDTKYTIDNGGVVAYKREHFESLAKKNRRVGRCSNESEFYCR